MKHHCDIAIICALEVERNALLSLFNSKVKSRIGSLGFILGLIEGNLPLKVSLFQVGVGPDTARSSFEAFLEHVSPERVLIVGLSGSLTPNLKLEEIVSPRLIIDETNGTRLECSGIEALQKREELGPLLVSVRAPLFTIEQKRGMHEKTNAELVDMESFVIAKLCQRENIPFSCVRVISDDLSTDLSPRLQHLIDHSGNSRYSRVFWELLKRPWFLFQLLQLNTQTQKSLKNLLRFLKTEYF